ncbi:MAG: hypothetical protein M3Y87_13740 [Myxococcota bacterium]|nr:hypothetical protein [Myxococcota bacterium]
MRRTWVTSAIAVAAVLQCAVLLGGCPPSDPVPGCNTAENCGQCVGIRDCGWCGAEQACIRGNSETPPATCAGQWRWVPGTCPPPTSGAP